MTQREKSHFSVEQQSEAAKNKIAAIRWKFNFSHQIYVSPGVNET